MGQYFIAVNETKHEYLHPHELGDGLKALELLSGSTPAALAWLMLRSSSGTVSGAAMAGRWAGDSVSIVGDYDASELYSVARESFMDISAEVRADIERCGRGVVTF